EDLANVLGAQGPPSGADDRVLDEADAAVGHQDVHTARVCAARVDAPRLVEAAAGAAEGARAKLVLLFVRRLDRLEQRVRPRAKRPELAVVRLDALVLLKRGGARLKRLKDDRWVCRRVVELGARVGHTLSTVAAVAVPRVRLASEALGVGNRV